MKKIYNFKSNKYRKFINTKILYILNETFVLSIICDKCDGNDKRIFKEKESTKILKIPCLINKMNNI